VSQRMTTRGARRVAVLVAACGVLLAVPSTGLGACWASSHVIVRDHHTSTVDALAQTSAGRTVVLWWEDLGLIPTFAGELDRESVGILNPETFAWRARRPLTKGRDSSFGGLAVAADDDIVAAWYENRVLRWARLGPTSSTWTPTRRIPYVSRETSPYDFHLIGRDDGSVVAIWAVPSLTGWTLRSATLAPAATHWADPHTLDAVTGSVNSGDPPSVELVTQKLRSGVIEIEWGFVGQRRLLTIAPGSSRSDDQHDATGLETQSSPELTIGADGTIVALWTVYTTRAGANGTSDERAQVFASVRHPTDRAFSPPQPLTPDAPYLEGNAIATVGADGAATAVVSVERRIIVVVQSPSTRALPSETAISSPGDVGVHTFVLSARSHRFTPATRGPASLPVEFVALEDGTALALLQVGDRGFKASRGVPGAPRWGTATHTFAYAGSVNSRFTTLATSRGALIGWTIADATVATQPRYSQLMAASLDTTGACSRWGLPVGH
jgi:hypothetical protein